MKFRSNFLNGYFRMGWYRGLKKRKEKSGYQKIKKIDYHRFYRKISEAKPKIFRLMNIIIKRQLHCLKKKKNDIKL